MRGGVGSLRPLLPLHWRIVPYEWGIVLAETSNLASVPLHFSGKGESAPSALRTVFATLTLLLNTSFLHVRVPLSIVR